MKKKLIAIALSVATTSVFAANLELKNSLQAQFPGTKITSAEFINEFPGLVEMIVDKNKIIYTNKEGTHFLVGHVFDAKNNVDVTQSRIDSLTSYSFDQLPLNDAIKVVKGNGAREFAVFTDPACPFCQKLEVELAQLTDYTMHVFPTAFKQEGGRIMGKILCETDQAKAWTDYMQKGIQPTSAKSCGEDQLRRVISLAGEMGVSGTPSLLAKNGKLRPGYAPAQQLNGWLDANSGKGK